MKKDALRHRILVICTGNLCRSPAAEVLLRRGLEDRKITDVEVSSAGLLDLDGAEATWEIVEIAKEDDLDLTTHRSRPVCGAMLKAATMIVVMERRHQLEIERLNAEASQKIRLLGEFEPPSDEKEEIDIKDPYGLSLTDHRRAYDRIRACVDGLLEEVSTPKEGR